MNSDENLKNKDAAVWYCAGGSCLRNGLFGKQVKIRQKPERVLQSAGSIQASPVFDKDGVCYVADMSGLIQAFAPDGKPLWQIKLEGGVIASPAICLRSGVLFAGTVSGSVYAIDSKKGKPLLKKAIPTASDPRILSDLLYVEKTNLIVLSSWGGRFYALDADSLEEKLSWDAGISPRSSAAADPDGNIFCLRAVDNAGIEFLKISPDGRETVIYTEPGGRRGARRALVAAAPVIDNVRKRIYFVANRDVGANLGAISTESNGLIWKIGLPVSIQATPMIRSDGVIVVLDLRGNAHGFMPSGDLIFQYKTDCEYLLSAAVSEQGGTTIFGDPLGRVHILNERGSGKVILETERAIQAQPSFSPGGKLYIPSTDKKVYVFGVAG